MDVRQRGWTCASSANLFNFKVKSRKFGRIQVPQTHTVCSIPNELHCNQTGLRDVSLAFFLALALLEGGLVGCSSHVVTVNSELNKLCLIVNQGFV